MNRYKINILFNYCLRNNIRYITTYNHGKNGLDLIKNFTPKQIGKIAIDVSKCANSDIKIWDNFKELSINSINSFDYKDFKDLTFFNFVIDKLFEFCDSYNCAQLSQITQIISNFNNLHIDFCKLFSKVAVLFKLRLAEATHNDIVKLLNSFSRVGIYDKPLTDTLVQLVLKNNFTLDELKSVSISCTLLGHHDSDLLSKLCDMYHKDNSCLTLNDLGILSFIFSKSSFTNDKVVSIFERNLNRTDNPHLVELNGMDLPSLCLNLHSMGVQVPENLINLIDFKSLQPNLSMEMLDLFSLYPSKQESILDKCKEIKRSTEDNIKLLNYISRGPFNEISRQLFNIVMRDAIKLGKSDLSVLLADACLLKLPVTWLLEEQMYDLNHGCSSEFEKMLLCVQASIISFIMFFTNGNVTGYSNEHWLVNNHNMSLLINKIEGKLSGITDEKSLLNTLLDVVPLENDVPHILVKEFERLLCKEIKVQFHPLDIHPFFTSKHITNETVIYERIKVMLVEDTQSVFFPIYPNDLIQLEMPRNGLAVGPSFHGIPPCSVPRTPVLIKMYIISKLKYNLIPVCYYEWNRLGDDDEKAKYLLIYICVCVNLIICDDNGPEQDSSHIHLNIEYPQDEAGKLNLNTGENQQKLELKTPVVIISPTPLVDYERLYKKMMKIKPGVSGKKNPGNV
ncbi:uncharacterized protein TOT_030000798 [Theileria orientalis strain Shintoku]|uniref:RAP domain-containing protein n=1 Tax=Theileria orientalis strain Shintoku TaxID=869250 RepID=J4D9Q6_THEOR|nr:uncharacterized protein TOT_030000798 [Theileria orientalis strain Shintoku]BAM41535.1 uncharacterized protein TOT_030000798 [Theileria orientalis strain Shintoku]|eukprot:XP_009691836.1 uncharacterized protein TOT_030000798 [Theileria orientalis strain Shintoku]